MCKKTLARLSVFFLTAILVVAFSLSAPAQELKTVEIKRAYTAWTGQVAAALGQKKGFYEEYGLDVKMLPSKGSADSTKAVAMNRQSIGIANAVTTMIGRSKGMPLVVVGCLYQKSPIGVVFRENSGIKEPKDLEGKRVVANPQASKGENFLAFLGKTNVDVDAVNMVSVDQHAEKMMFASGKVDAMLAFVFREKPLLEKLGIDIDWFLFHDYGVKALNLSLITNEKTIQEDPELVRNVTQATMKSWSYAIKHPEEAIEAYIEKNPELNKEIELKQFKNGIPFTQSPAVEKYGFGYMSQDMWEATQETAITTGELQEEIVLEEIYTNEFLK